MDYQEIDPRYLEVRRLRLTAYSHRASLTAKEASSFEVLEDKMNSGNLAQDWLRSFHLSNDDYMRLLHKVLKAAVKVGEPLAKEKLQLFIEEKGTQGPAVFLTPWDMTLAYLDGEVGEFSKVAQFYGVSEAA